MPLRRQRLTLSRQKRQDLLFGGGGILKDIFGIAYTTDVHGLNSRISEAEDRLNIQVRKTCMTIVQSDPSDWLKKYRCRVFDILRVYMVGFSESRRHIFLIELMSQTLA